MNPIIRALIIDNEPLARDLIRDHISSRPNFRIVGETGTADEAIRFVETLHPDLMFLDTHVRDITAFQLLKRINVVRMPSIIFVTAYSEYALRAFEVDAVDYLVKPVDKKRFSEALDRVIRQKYSHDKMEIIDRALSVLSHYQADSESNPSAAKRRFPMRDEKGRTRFIDGHYIDWIEAAGDYVCIHMGTENHIVRQRLNDFQSSLSPDFVRIHRSYIVNKNRIIHMQELKDRKFIVELTTSKTLPVSRTHYKNLKACLKG